MGKLYIVGFGPGDFKNMTFWAKQALDESDVVVGYETYIELLEPYIQGKEIIQSGMTEEVERATRAVDIAWNTPKTVSIVSSGDPGIYGMAALVFEILLRRGWRPGMNPEVVVVPGVTAANAVASLVGAPLSVDFAVVSMSDLLVPWEIIEKRIRAAAEGDFVIVIYNPKSKRRTWQIKKTRDILLEYRSPDTPVAMVKNAYREGQKVVFTTLEKMSDEEILGMLTTVIVGNSTTVLKDGIMFNPRGYSSKYRLD